MVIVCFAGVGASLPSGGAAALTLVTATVCVQLLVFLWITCLCPSIDRIENLVAALGWGVESCSMLMLVLASFFPSLQTDGLQAAAYVLSLTGVGLPLFKLGYEGLLAPLGSCFLRYIDGEARTNPCSMGTLLWFLRLLLALGHKLAANCCTGGLGGETTGTATRTDMADSGVVYGGRDDGNPFGLSHMADSGVIYAYGGRDDRVTQRRAAREEAEEAFGRNDDCATSARMTTAEATPSVAPSVAPSAAPGAAPGSAPAADRAAGMDAAHGAGSLPAAGETRSRRTLANSPRAQTEPASVAAPTAALGAAAAASASASAAAAALRPQREIGRPRKLRLTPPHPGTAWTHARGICHGLNAIQHPCGVGMGWESPAEGEPAAAAAASAVFGRPSEGLSAELASELSDLSA